MHYHLEIVMPKTNDIEKAIKEIMAPFDENSSYENNENFSGNPFWDWYVIGGRWAGTKQQAALPKDKIDAFHNELKKRKVTVSGFTSGKQSLQPESQIPMVDTLWKEYFPDFDGDHCPLFQHSNDQYNEWLPGDVMSINNVSKTLTAHKIIFAAANYNGTGLSAETMFRQDLWNGVCYEKTEWNGEFGTALQLHLDEISRYTEEARQKYTPNENWIAVTVDYHS